MSLKNTKKGEKISTSVDGGSQEKNKPLVSICIISQNSYISKICIYKENEVWYVIINLFQELIEPANLSARYDKLGLEARSNNKHQPIIKSTYQPNNQDPISRQTNIHLVGEKGNFRGIQHKQNQYIKNLTFFKTNTNFLTSLGNFWGFYDQSTKLRYPYSNS